MDVAPRITEADALDIDWPEGGCLILDPPWDQMPTMAGALVARARDYPSVLVFTDARRIGDAVGIFGPPAWLFAWDTMSPWTTGPRRPLQQVKYAAWYGDLDKYRRDAVLWGAPPEAKDHPSTKSQPLDGRRLTDLHRESLRWLHNPAKGSGTAVRHRSRAGSDVLRHAKPVGWVRCLIGNCSSGLVVDPFCGSGTSLVAAMDLGRPSWGCDINPEAVAFSRERCAQGVLL